MATSATQLAKSGKFGDLRRRLVFLLLALVVYRLGAHIPVPGIDPNQLQQLFKGQQGGILSLFNMFSGGALSRFTVFALGIMPYISASIIMQLMSYVVPTLEALKKEGESGRKKLNQYTRYLTVVLAVVQSFGIAVGLSQTPGLVENPGLFFIVATVVIKMGLRRSRLAFKIASSFARPSRRSAIVWSTWRIEFFFTTPKSTKMPSAEKMLSDCLKMITLRIANGMVSGKLSKIVIGWRNDSNCAASTRYMKMKLSKNAIMKLLPARWSSLVCPMGESL